jgi:hypothetical protein
MGVRNAEVQVSVNGVAFTGIAPILSSSAINTVTFPAQTSQYLRIMRIGGTGGDIWAVEEMAVACDSGSAAVPGQPRRPNDSRDARLEVFSINGRAFGNAKMPDANVLGGGVYIIRRTDGTAFRCVQADPERSGFRRR